MRTKIVPTERVLKYRRPYLQGGTMEVIGMNILGNLVVQLQPEIESLTSQSGFRQPKAKVPATTTKNEITRFSR